MLIALRQHRISMPESVAPAILIATPANANRRPAAATKAAPVSSCPRCDSTLLRRSVVTDSEPSHWRVFLVEEAFEADLGETGVFRSAAHRAVAAAAASIQSGSGNPR